MSLDFYLVSDLPQRDTDKGSGIFIRENGSTKEISREEWDEKFPNREPVVVRESENAFLFTSNITHNLTEMADKAGIYKALWHPVDNGYKRASDIIGVLREGIAQMEKEPERFTPYNPDNGWGSYEGLLAFTKECLEACEQHPHALLETST